MTILQRQSIRLSPRFSELPLAACLLVLSALLLFGRELAMAFPGGAPGPATRLGISAIFAWGLLRPYAWAWWTSVLVGGLWLLMDFMTVAAIFAMDMSLEPVYQWPLFPIVGAFIAQAVAIALLLRQRTGLSSPVTLIAILLALVVVIVGFRVVASRFGNEGTHLIYSTVAEKVRTPAVKVWMGAANGVRGVRVVIGDSNLVRVDSAAQAGVAREIAILVRSLLPIGSDLQFIAIGWSLDTGPGAMPSQMHRFSVDELPNEAIDTAGSAK